MQLSKIKETNLSNLRFDFPNEELLVINYWSSIDAFNQSIKLNINKPLFTFYDGININIYIYKVLF